MQHPQQSIGQAVYDAAGEKVGEVANVYVSERTGVPDWVTVRTGLFGTKESFVPLTGARMTEDGLHVSATKASIKDAPRIDDEGHLSDDEAAGLYRYYGMDPNATDGTAGTPGQDAAGQQTGRHAGQQTAERRGTDATSTTDAAAGDRRTGARGDGARAEELGREERTAAGTDSDQGVVRSEERLRAGTETVESGRVRLRKYVVTEEQQITVPVSHEEATIVREPIQPGTAAPDAGSIGDDEREVVLHEERPVVSKETVPVERVGIVTETVTGEQQVSDDVRKEQIEVDGANERPQR